MDPQPTAPDAAAVAAGELRARLETRVHALQEQQQQYLAQVHAAAGALELCRQLIAELSNPAPPAAAGG
jgi:hypothetical protein